MVYKFFLITCLFSQLAFSQGIVNNGARIVLTNTSHIVVNGSTGNYKNQNNGFITNASTGGTITVNGSWINEASNVAFSNDGATVRLSGGNQTIGGTNSTTFYHLNLLGTGTKTLGVNTTVGGISTLTGVLSIGTRPLDLNSRTLTISNPNSSAITNSTGYIISETNAATNPSIVRWNMGTNTGAHIYPFGVSGTLIPFTFHKTTAGAADISVSTRSTSGGNNTPWATTVTTMASYTPTYLADASSATVIDRWWDITASAAVIANLRFSYRGSENTTTFAPTGAFSAQHWNGTGWDAPVGSGAGVTSGVGVVDVTGASSFSPWVLSSNNSPLPVQLVSLSASCDKPGKVIVSWTTASEQNSQKFIVQKSRDLIEWFEADEYPAAGSSNYYINYFITDYSPFDGISYYRLIQVDNDGTQELFGPISVPCSGENGIIVYPNPSNGSFIAEIISSEDLVNTVAQLIDVTGKIVSSRPIYIVDGKTQVMFDESNLAQGAYIVRILAANQIQPVKILVR